MKIIIPMSGFGERFRRAGYTIPKPLIEVEGKPIIAHVLDMFPDEKDVIFICNNEHLESKSFGMKKILMDLCPTAKIRGIEPHTNGPVYALQMVKDEIGDDEQVIVNYCDFTCYWDYNKFKKTVSETKCDGAIPAYTGFHPHLIWSTNYAYMKTDGKKVLDIQEKNPYTDIPMQEYASSGTYYFSTGKKLKEYSKLCIEQNLHVNNEFYVSMTYKPMLEHNENIIIFDVEHFMQWGTPEDLSEYVHWSNLFRTLIGYTGDNKSRKGTIVMPMAGEGSRFKNEGYTVSKPLIEVDNMPMFQRAVNGLPDYNSKLFIIREDADLQNVISKLKTNSNIKFKLLKNKTEGQACTVLEACVQIEIDPVIVAACDSSALYDIDTYDTLLRDSNADMIVWTAKSHPPSIRYPEMYGWVYSDENKDITDVAVKKVLNSPLTDSVIIGTFTFKRKEDYERLARSLISRNGRINGEFYIDSLIQDAIDEGLIVKEFEVDYYLCWGTPNELSTYNYWKTCFTKWVTHPYIEHSK